MQTPKNQMVTRTVSASEEAATIKQLESQGYTVIERHEHGQRDKKVVELRAKNFNVSEVSPGRTFID